MVVVAADATGHWTPGAHVCYRPPMSEPNYPGIDGFLGTRAALTVDLLVVSMLFVVVVLGWSVYQARYRRRYQLHKRVQLTLADLPM